jgi:signal peptidase I
MDTALELIKNSEGEYYLPVSGISMLPLLRAGDYVRIKQISEDLHRGDIVVFQKSNVLITHRILCISKADDSSMSLLTKGDNSIFPDPPIKSRVIIGKVVAIRRNNREMRLDNRGWQITNHLIGLLISVLVMLYSAIIGPRTMKTGEELGFSNRLVRRCLMTISSLVIKLLQLIIGRWKSYNVT